jgi:ribonuclease HI
MARSVWALAPAEIDDVVMNQQEPHAKAWLAALFQALPHMETTRVVVTMWALWHARRKIIHEGLFQPPLSTHMFVERFLADLEILAPAPVAVTAERMLVPKWIPPPVGFAKVNVDAALSKNSSTGAIAAVVRGSDGLFLGASSVVIIGVTDPEMLEAMACREGMALATDISLQRFILASDCSNAISSIRGEGMGSYGHIVQEIKARVMEFQTVQFVHEGRKSNVDAHVLARSSIYLELGRHVWFIDPPQDVCKQQTII